MGLNISEEVTRHRLERFMDQDISLPVDRKEMAFKNCSADQRGIQCECTKHAK